MTQPVIFGCEGLSLSQDEKSFFSDVKPYGFILFQRNCDTPEQIAMLTAELRACVGKVNLPILIDQEGGRVQRMKPPHWPDYPTMQTFGDLFMEHPEKAVKALKLNCLLIADDLRKVGVSVNCLPLLDLPQDGADNIIGDRAFARDPNVVIALGDIVVKSLMAGGVLPVIKHIPGHGRATVDSHYKLPVVDTPHSELSEHDFAPFQALNSAPYAMTAHIIYSALDKINPVTLSDVIIKDIIRSEMGFRGLLMSDDLSMKALSGSYSEKARKSIEAGCDLVLHCNGNMAEMVEISSAIPHIRQDVIARTDAWLAEAELQPMIDRQACEAQYKECMIK